MPRLPKADIANIFQTFAAHNPQPKTELVYNSTFELLTAVLLSAQATDTSVNKATAKLFPVANTPQTILDLGQENLEQYIRTIGLYRSKARHLMQTCKTLLQEYNGQVPNTRVNLEKLPGVGRKTANVILNVAFGQPTMAVDTHIFRVSNRMGLAHGKTPLAVEQQLLQRIPKEFLDYAHHWLILHGRYTCKARKPECTNCAVATWCLYKNKN